MLFYLIKRVLAVIPVMLIVAVIVFLMLRLTPGDPAAIVADTDKIRETLGWRPQLNDLDQIVVQALAWEHLRNC